MEPKLMLGALALAAGALMALTLTLRGGHRGVLAGAGVDEGVDGGPGVVQPLRAAGIGSSLPRPAGASSAASRAVPAGSGPAASEPGVGGLEDAVDVRALQARLAELEQENEALRFRLAEAERRLAARAAAEVTGFLAGVRASLDEHFTPDDFVLQAGGRRADFRRDVESVLFDVARHLRTQDLDELRRVADVGRVRQVVAVLDVFHRRRLVDGVEDWVTRKRQIAAIFRLPLYPGT